jgi:serine/threonine protein kinase
LGEGGMGAVYRALDRVNEEVVALKRVKVAPIAADASDATKNKQMMNRVAISEEFKALASLHHPNIIGVLDYGWDSEGVSFFTMRHLDNTKNIIDGSRDVSIEQRFDYFIQLMQALMYVHRRGIVHRDLKPDNILLTVDGKVKVLDFGIAIAENAVQEELVGTLLYMPPEVIRSTADTPISRAADLYAAGLIAYEMFTGIYPFDTNDTKDLIRDILKTYPDLSLIPKIKSENHTLKTRLPLETVIGRLISKEPNFRYEDAADVIIDLSKVVGKESISESTEVRESFLQAATFIGRRRERKFLLTLLQTLKKEHIGSTVLIGGESGVGKSRLMEEIRIQALVQGIRVYRGQAVSNLGLPFQLWRDIVRKLVLATDITDKHASFLREIVPDIQDLLGRDIPALPQLSPMSSEKTSSMRF